MLALVASIHALKALHREKAWMAGTSPAMTNFYNQFRFDYIRDGRNSDSAGKITRSASRTRSIRINGVTPR